jgi:tetratricopeptide (TPR) repeat protein
MNMAKILNGRWLERSLLHPGRRCKRRDVALPGAHPAQPHRNEAEGKSLYRPPMGAPTLQSLTDDANALKAAGRLDEAIEVYRQAAVTAPWSAVAEHNLAGALGDAWRCAEAESHCRRAFAKGLDAPETWLVLARALQGQGRLAEADGAYREALRRRPRMADAHRDAAQLVWMRTGDAAAAVAALDVALAEAPLDEGLLLVKAQVLEFTERFDEAYGLLAQALKHVPSPAIDIVAVNAALRIGRPDLALAHAERAVSAAPGHAAAHTVLAQARLAVGQVEAALEGLEALIAAFPDDQYLLALQATAWRLKGDARYGARYDYQNLVRAWTIDAPPAWPTLEAYLSDLAADLRAEHFFEAHPFSQSLRQGAQASAIYASARPAIQAFAKAVERPIAEHLAALGPGDDPVRRRNTGRWAFRGMWSVRLKPGGRHVDHTHPQGWLSSACYIELPRAVEGSGREGWIKFGEPGVPTQPALGPEHFVKPEPGKLVLFPSYMWHGTIPFSGSQERLTVAFDLVPG